MTSYTWVSERLTAWVILLVCKDENDTISHIGVVQCAMKLCFCLFDAVTILGVDDKQEAIIVSVIMFPQRPKTFQAADVPPSETIHPVVDLFDVETLCSHIRESRVSQLRRRTCRDSDYSSSQLQLVENR
jgi:hypothetical protein